jgi:ribosomal-protein-alanine N-acetyltransferase
MLEAEVLSAATCRLRPYRPGDVDGLLAVADDPLVARWMTARFPHPYTRADAETWVALATAVEPAEHFVIEVGGTFAGAVGVMARRGEFEGVAIFGYWLGRAYWGRGIATDAARTLSDHAFRTRGVRRLEATVFSPNAASARVLEKCGFTLEARMREGVVERDGTVCDMLLYSRLASDAKP